MEAARPGGRRRRARRGTVDRPLNVRLVRVAALMVAPALIALLFSISTTGTLPRPLLEPLFDTASAATLAGDLSTRHPARVPGSLGADGAAAWYAETIARVGLTTSEDVWTTDLPDLGRVELRNIVTVIRGRSDESIVVVAHRDNAGVGASFGDNASGTAALVEIARGYAPQQDAPAPLPDRTLVLVSTDAGAFGGAGAARFAENSAYADLAVAAVVLDGLGGRGRPRLAVAGNDASSPARTLVSTAAARIEEQAGTRPQLPSVLAQLVDLGIPFAYGEQGPFLEHGIAAVTLTTDDPGDPAVPAGDDAAPLAEARLGALGRSTEALVASIDGSVRPAFRTSASLFLGERAASGWAVRLTLVVAVAPFVLGVLDLLIRSRRHRVPLKPALRAIRSRFLFALFGGLLVWIGAIADVFPTGEALPLPLSATYLTDVPVSGLGLLAVILGAGWLLARRPLAAATPPTSEERLAGYTVALVWLAALAILIALFRPFAVVFLLPSMYAWLWLPLRTRLWPRVGVYAAGLLGPVLALVVLGRELGLGLVEAPLYAVGLVTVGYVPVVSVVLFLAWLAAAAQLGALAVGRYGPYADGREPPPPGPVRLLFARAVRARRR
jgi:Peptidase family M28